MKTIEQYIDDIKINRANFLYLANSNGVINGTLRGDIAKMMQLYSEEQKGELDLIYSQRDKIYESKSRERDELKKEIQRLKELLNQVVRASEETRLILCGYDEEEAKIKSAEVWEQFKIDKNL